MLISDQLAPLHPPTSGRYINRVRSRTIAHKLDSPTVDSIRQSNRPMQWRWRYDSL